MSVPITPGTGASSVAAEVVGGLNYQQIQVYGGGGSSILGINPDRSINVSVIGTPTVNFTGSPSISGAVTIVGNASVSGTVGASVVGWVPIQASNTSVITVWQNSSIATVPTGNQSVSGTVGASIIGTVPIVQSGTLITSVVSTVPSSVLVGASIFGQLPAGTAVLGSVAALQGTDPWSVTPVGSTITIWQTPSIVGSFSDDAAHGVGAKGIFILGVRNDAQSSITSADNDYTPIGLGPTGAVIATDAPINKWVQGTADLRVVLGASVTAIPAQGASIFTYIREIQVANMGSASVLVTFGGGLGSILGYTIAPAGGGSNFITRLKTGENSAFTASISGTASVLVSAQGFTAKI